MSVFDAHGLREFRREYERRSEGADKAVDEYVCFMAPGTILNYVCEEIHEGLELWWRWEAARQMVSPNVLPYFYLLLQAAHELSKVELQDSVLELKGLSLELPDALSSAAELRTLRAKTGAQASEDNDRLLENGRFLAYVTSLTAGNLEKCRQIEDATGIPSATVVGHIRVLLQVARQLRILELENARLRVKALGIEFPEVLVRAIERGDCDRICRILTSQNPTK